MNLFLVDATIKQPLGHVGDHVAVSTHRTMIIGSCLAVNVMTTFLLLAFLFAKY